MQVSKVQTERKAPPAGRRNVIMTGTSRQGLTHHVAICHDCGKQCNARNAQGWAHQHVQRTGHAVELQLAWRVSPEGPRRATPALVAKEN